MWRKHEEGGRREKKEKRVGGERGSKARARDSEGCSLRGGLNGADLEPEDVREEGDEEGERTKGIAVEELDGDFGGVCGAEGLDESEEFLSDFLFMLVGVREGEDLLIEPEFRVPLSVEPRVGGRVGQDAGRDPVRLVEHDGDDLRDAQLGERRQTAKLRLGPVRAS